MNIVSPKLDYLLGSSVPTLSLSEAERRVYHNGNVSDAPNPQRIFDTMMMP